MIASLSSVRFPAVAAGIALVVGLGVMPGTEEVASAAQQVDLLLEENREAPAVVVPPFEPTAPSFPEGDFLINDPVVVAGPEKAQADREGPDESLGVEDLADLPGLLTV